MATHKLAEGDVGAQEETLTPNVVDVVEFAEDFRFVEILNLDAAVGIYATVDGNAPTVGGSGCIFIPPGMARYVTSNAKDKTVVQLIAEGAPSYCVARVTG